MKHRAVTTLIVAVSSIVLILLCQPTENIIVQTSKIQSIVELSAEFGLNDSSIEVLHNKSGLFLLKPDSKLQSYLLQGKSHLSEKIEWFELDRPLKATSIGTDPDFHRQWGLKNRGQKLERAQTVGLHNVDIAVEKAWEITKGSKDVIVAITDSGMDLTHPDLRDNLWVNEAERDGRPGVDDDNNGFIDDIHGWDFANKDNDPTDDNQHGTHIAGIIGAEGNNNIGISGVNWKVRMMPVKWLDSGLRGATSDAVKSLHYAMDMGAQVINCSWGEDNDEDSYEVPIALQKAIERAERENVVIVAAAGNEGYDLQHGVFFPASFKNSNVISVAAINNRAELWSAGGFGSNFGAKDVDIAAPGEDVPSYVLGQKVKALSGTSMAAPFVAGVAALILSHKPDLSAREVKQRIVQSAQTFPGLRTKIKSSGIVNAYYAVTGQPHPLDPNDPFNGAHFEHNLKIKDYALNADLEFKISHPGAQKIAVHFKRFHLTFGDHLIIKDGQGNPIKKLNGTHTGEFSPYVEGDTIILNLKSDDYGYNGMGILVDKVSVVRK